MKQSFAVPNPTAGSVGPMSSAGAAAAPKSRAPREGDDDKGNDDKGDVVAKRAIPNVELSVNVGLVWARVSGLVWARVSRAEWFGSQKWSMGKGFRPLAAVIGTCFS